MVNVVGYEVADQTDSLEALVRVLIPAKLDEDLVEVEDEGWKPASDVENSYENELDLLDVCRCCLEEGACCVSCVCDWSECDKEIDLLFEVLWLE